MWSVSWQQDISSLQEEQRTALTASLDFSQTRWNVMAQYWSATVLNSPPSHPVGPVVMSFYQTWHPIKWSLFCKWSTPHFTIPEFPEDELRKILMHKNKVRHQQAVKLPLTVLPIYFLTTEGHCTYHWRPVCEWYQSSSRRQLCSLSLEDVSPFHPRGFFSSKDTFVR